MRRLLTVAALTLAVLAWAPARARAETQAPGAPGNIEVVEGEGAEGGAHHGHEKPAFNTTQWGGKTKDGGPAPGFMFALINFAILLTILSLIAVPKLKTFIRDRSAKMAKDLDDAARTKAEAEAKLAEYQAKLARLDDDVAKLAADIRAEAESERNRLVAAAEASAARAMADAEKTIAGELARMRAHLEREAVTAAIEAATKIIRERIGDADQKALADRFIKSIEAARTSKSGGAA
ncbi:MAG: ATP synthase F0 subunit B [Deltaproteobacteria bacterium]|nr:ATP synthase F0 subunit B [Deltaproteobacteria bacterium]